MTVCPPAPSLSIDHLSFLISHFSFLISHSPSRLASPARSRRSRATTLIELILVMAVLATIMAISAPALSRFFAGRALTEEARRFLALTRYARSQAVSAAVPMELWIDPETGAYGLTARAGDEFADLKPVEFALADGIAFEFVEAEETGSGTSFGVSVTDDGAVLNAGIDLRGDGRTVILFWPDGSVDEASPVAVRLVQTAGRSADEAGETIEIGQDAYGLGYAIRTPEEAAALQEQRDRQRLGQPAQTGGTTP